MDVLGQQLDAREGPQNAQDRQKAAEAWMLTGKRPEERLLAFDRWVRGELEKRLEWGWAGEHKERRIEQCRIRLESMVLELWRRGWMLDGARLARRIEELLDAVGKYQRAGGVADFWAYFEACVRRYVGLNAEEISAESLRAGAHVNQMLGRFMTGQAKPVSLPELVAERAVEVAEAKAPKLREKIARARAKRIADANQGQLL